VAKTAILLRTGLCTTAVLYRQFQFEFYTCIPAFAKRDLRLELLLYEGFSDTLPTHLYVITLSSLYLSNCDAETRQWCIADFVPAPLRARRRLRQDTTNSLQQGR